MKLSLKAVNGKLRFLAQRVGQGLKHVLDCCCVTPQQNLYVVGYNCCEGWESVPRIAVKLDIVRQLESQCSWEYALIVRLAGNESCFQLVALFGNTIPYYVFSTREAAVAAGLTIVEDRNLIQCVTNNRENPQVRCGTQSCPECPRNCCFVHIYPKECPDFHRLPTDKPKENLCCSWGRDYTITINYNTRLVEEYYNLIGELYVKNVVTYSGSEVVRRIMCDANDPDVPGGIECLSASHYKSQEFTTRDGTTFSEERLNRCITPAYPVRQSAPIYGPGDTVVWPSVTVFPARPGRTVGINPDGSSYTTITFDGGDLNVDGPVCNDLDEFVSSLIYAVDRNDTTEERFTTTFRYGLTCLQGSSLFDQTREVISRPDNTLYARVRFVHRASFSVAINSNTFCPRTVCDGYAQTGNIVSLSGLPPQPIQGALNLL